MFHPGSLQDPANTPNYHCCSVHIRESLMITQQSLSPRLTRSYCSSPSLVWSACKSAPGCQECCGHTPLEACIQRSPPSLQEGAGCHCVTMSPCMPGRLCCHVLQKILGILAQMSPSLHCKRCHSAALRRWIPLLLVFLCSCRCGSRLPRCPRLIPADHRMSDGDVDDALWQMHSPKGPYIQPCI